MHELHLIHDLIQDLITMGTQHGTARITKVYITMGEFTEINPDILRFHFKEATKNTIAEGATIDITPTFNRELNLVSFDCE